MKKEVSMFRKLMLIFLILFFIMRAETFALDLGIVEIRNKLFEESSKIKSSLTASKDAVMMVNMFDSCILSVNQIDAYYSMLGVMETIKGENLTRQAVDLVVDWLNAMKKTNELNIKNLETVTQQIEPATRVFLGRIKGYFRELNKKLDRELSRLLVVKLSLQR
jgi:hypothetical protein